MPRHKAKIKDHRMLVVVKSSFGEKFDEKQIGLLQQWFIDIRILE